MIYAIFCYWLDYRLWFSKKFWYWNYESKLHKFIGRCGIVVVYRKA